MFVAGSFGIRSSLVASVTSGGVVDSGVQACRVSELRHTTVVFEHKPLKVQVYHCQDTSLILRESAVGIIEIIDCVRCRAVVERRDQPCTVTVDKSQMCVVEVPESCKVFSSDCCGLTLQCGAATYWIPEATTLSVTFFDGTGWCTRRSNDYGDPIADSETETVECSGWRKRPPPDTVAQRLFKIVAQRASRPVRLPCQVSEDLFLGDAQTVQNIFRLRSLGITHVLNMAHSGTSRVDYSRANIVYKGIAAMDAPGYDIMQHFEECQAFYDEVVAAGGCLVVHCVAGINRSGAIITALYATKTNAPLFEAAVHVQACRGSYLWNATFRASLVEWAYQNNIALELGEET